MTVAQLAGCLPGAMATDTVKRLSMEGWSKLKSYVIDEDEAEESPTASSTEMDEPQRVSPELGVTPDDKPIKQRRREPQWTEEEVKKFWAVLEPYVADLVSPTTTDLPKADINFMNLDSSNCSHLDRCLLSVQEQLWAGQYSQSVSNLQATLDFFQGWETQWKRRQEAEDGAERVKAETAILREIFLKKMPNR